MVLTQRVADLERQLAEMALQREEQEQRIQRDAQNLQMMKSMLEIVPVGVVVADQSGRIIHGNAHVEAMLRHPVLHSANISQYAEWVSFHADGRRVESGEYPLARIISEGEEQAQLECRYQRGDGSLCWIRIDGKALRDKEGHRIGAAVALIDIDNEMQQQAQQKVMIGELNHRVKNAFAVVKAIVSQSLRKAKVASEIRENLESRLEAYGIAHAKLVGTTWNITSLEAIARDTTAAFGDGRIDVQGPFVVLPSRQALALSMAFYELATNALKYGSLAHGEGKVTLTWDYETEEGAPMLVIHWVERGGPPPIEPKHKGFGSFVIDRALAAETNGTVTLSYDPSGFEWTARLPLTH